MVLYEESESDHKQIQLHTEVCCLRREEIRSKLEGLVKNRKFVIVGSATSALEVTHSFC
jgi:hypothetical protein